MRLRSYQKRRLKNQLHPEINITPLIDVALTLLIIFMVATPAIKQKDAQKQSESIAVKAEALAGSGAVKKVMEIFLQKDGVMLYGNKKISFLELKKMVQSSFNASQEVGIVVNPDSVLACGKVIDLVKSLQGLQGVSYVELITHDTF